MGSITILYPTNNSWTISLNALEADNIHIQLFDISGKLLQSKNKDINYGLNKIEQNGSNLSSGTYILEIKGKNFNIQEKLIRK